MQFHLNRFEPGDPEISDPARRYSSSGCSGALPSEVDVLIVGCGPAGLTLAAQVAAFPDIKVGLIEQKPGPLQLGQADGIACRSVGIDPRPIDIRLEHARQVQNTMTRMDTALAFVDDGEMRAFVFVDVGHRSFSYGLPA